MVRARKTIAICANHDRMACVLFIGQQPMLWELVFKPTETTKKIEAQVRKWIDQFEPNLILTEDFKTAKRKGDRTKMVMEVIKRTAKRSEAPCFERLRLQPYLNRDDQIAELCERYPQLRSVAPKRRRHHDKEPAVTTIFDAVAMATNRSN